MSNNRISYLNISPYSRQSPSQLKTELKKNSNSVERPKSSKSAYGASSSRGNTPINNPEAIDRKYSPFVDRKGELMASLYNIAKTKTREKPTSAKAYKQRENSASSKKLAKNSSRPADKINEKLQIYQYLQNKSFKKSDEAKSFSQPLSYTPSRAGSRSNLEEKDNNNERRILEASILQQKQLIEALEEMHRSRNKASAYSNNRDNLANLLKSAQRPPTSTPAKAQYGNVSASVASVGKITDEKRKGSDSKRGDIFKDLRLNMNQSDIIQPQQKQKPVAQTAQKESSQQKRHRRGLSSGQNPLFVEQQRALEQQIAMEQQLALEQMAREQERQERQERERERQERERKEKERQKQQQLQMQMEQQMLLQQQMQMQMQQQQQYARDPQAEEDEYYERFFHMDRMTFDFERLVIAQKMSRQQEEEEAEEAEEEENKQPSRGGNGSTVSHHRTRSIEDPNALMPTKSSSRWTTKRSSVGEEPQLEQKSVGNFISDIDKTDVEKEEMRRYYKH